MLCVAAAAVLAAVAQATVAQATVAQPGSQQRRKNVLLIIVDDLRPEVAYMGERHMITPNIDALAKTSLVFNRAFCQQAICGPTRNSFLSGRRPQRTKTWNFIGELLLRPACFPPRTSCSATNVADNFREVGVGADWVAFPEYFKLAGYTTLGTGKTFVSMHPLCNQPGGGGDFGTARGPAQHPGSPPNFDMPKSWSNSCTGPRGTCTTRSTPNPANASDGAGGSRAYVFSTNGYPQCTGDHGRSDSLPHSLICPNAAPIESFSDTIDMRASISDLRYAAQKTESGAAKPFFLATGFHRPHLPWNIPQRFWDLYPVCV
jgi:iduronate 2-sulfatase